MRESNFVLKEMLRNGLRPERRPPLNAPYMLSMKNLIPTEYFVVSPPAITKPGDVSSQSFTHPFPTLYKGDNVTLLLGATSIKTATDDYTLSSAVTLNLRAGGTGSITSGGPWQVESFMDMWIATNGTSLVYKLPYDDGDVFVDNDIVVKALGRHDYRLMLGGLSGTWFTESRFVEAYNVWRETADRYFVHDALSMGTNFVVWGERTGGAVDEPLRALAAMIGLLGNGGYDSLEEVIWQAIEEGEIGIAPIRRVGTIRALKQLGDRMVVYGDNGISTLYPEDTGGFREELVCRFGVGGPKVVGGDDRRHLLIDNDGQLYSWRIEQHKPERLGYAEYLSALDLTITTISHDPVEDYYWITDGTKCYVYTRTGLGGDIYTRPSSLYRDDTYGLVGTYVTPEDISFELVTTPFDISERDRKHLDLIQLTGASITRPMARMEGNYGMDGSFLATPWVPFSPEGASHPALSFVEGKLSIKGYGTDVSISDIEIRYKGEGKRFRRGTAGVQDGA